MKKIFLAMALALTGISASAQQGEKAAGINLSYGTEHKALGIGVKGQYGITDAIRAEASFDYFLKKDGLSMWDINLNVHYLFSLTDKLKVYPLAGLTFTNWKFDNTFGIEIDPEYAKDLGPEYAQYLDEVESASASESKFGVNLGAGLQYDLTDKLSLNVEAKYQLISDFDQMMFGVGIAYKF